MTNSGVPEGWDDIPAELISGAKEMRNMYLAFVMSGFTMHEAAIIVAEMCMAAMGSGLSSMEDKDK